MPQPSSMTSFLLERVRIEVLDVLRLPRRSTGMIYLMNKIFDCLRNGLILNQRQALYIPSCLNCLGEQTFVWSYHDGI